MHGIVFQDCLAVYLTCVATFPLLFTNTSTGDIQCLPFAYSLMLTPVFFSYSSIHEMLIELIPRTALLSYCLFLGQVTVVSSLVMRQCRVCVHVGTETVSPSLRPLPCLHSPSGQHSLGSLLPHGYALRCHMTHRGTIINQWSTGRLECHNCTSIR